MQASSYHISIISNKDGRQDIEGQGNNGAEGAGTGAGIGAVASGAGGLLSASLYAEGVRRGSAVIAAKVEE